MDAPHGMAGRVAGGQCSLTPSLGLRGGHGLALLFGISADSARRRGDGGGLQAADDSNSRGVAAKNGLSGEHHRDYRMHFARVATNWKCRGQLPARIRRGCFRKVRMRKVRTRLTPAPGVGQGGVIFVPHYIICTHLLRTLSPLCPRRLVRTYETVTGTGVLLRDPCIPTIPQGGTLCLRPAASSLTQPLWPPRCRAGSLLCSSSHGTLGASDFAGGVGFNGCKRVACRFLVEGLENSSHSLMTGMQLSAMRRGRGGGGGRRGREERASRVAW